MHLPDGRRLHAVSCGIRTKRPSGMRTPLLSFSCISIFISVSSDFIKRIKAAKIPVAVLAGVAGLLFFLFGVRELTKYLQQLGDIIKFN